MEYVFLEATNHKTSSEKILQTLQKFPCAEHIWPETLLSETSAGKKKKNLPLATQFSGLINNLYPEHWSFQVSSISENVANEGMQFVRLK